MQNLPRLLVSCFVFMTVSLFTPACGSLPRFEGCDRSPDATSLEMDAPQNERVSVQNTPSFSDAGNAPLRDATLEAADARTEIDARAEPEDVMNRTPTTGARAVLLAPTSCHGRRLSMSALDVSLFEEDASVWHLCIKTPTRMTSDQSLANERPTHVRIGLIRDGRVIELLRAESPQRANPWTVSALVTIPNLLTSALFLEAIYTNGRTMNLLASGSQPRMQGELSLWRVSSDGTQVPNAADRACRFLRDEPRDARTFLLPTHECPLNGDSCSDLVGLTCTALGPT